MQKNDLWTLYQWVRKRLTEEERKLIQATKPNLLIATERELAIQLKAKLTLITKIIDMIEGSEIEKNYCIGNNGNINSSGIIRLFKNTNI